MTGTTFTPGTGEKPAKNTVAGYGYGMIFTWNCMIGIKHSTGCSAERVKNDLKRFILTKNLWMFLGKAIYEEEEP